MAKAPKVYLCDTGLLTHLLGVDVDRLRADPTLGGGILENFVATEILKQIGWSRQQPKLFHFLTHGGEEVDLVLENRAGQIVGVEVKATATLNPGHFKGLRALAAIAGENFVRGIVLYGGTTITPFGKDLLALPIPSLWS